jgi:hypothetical protein
MSLLLALLGGGSASATLAWTEDDDASALTVNLSQSAMLAWTESDDAASLSVTVAGSVSLAAAWTEDDDTTAIVIAAAPPVEIPTPASGGSLPGWTPYEQRDAALDVEEALMLIETFMCAVEP